MADVVVGADGSSTPRCWNYSSGDGVAVEDRDGNRHRCCKIHHRHWEKSDRNAGTPLTAAVPVEGVFSVPYTAFAAVSGVPAPSSFLLQRRRCRRPYFCHPVCLLYSDRYLLFNTAPQQGISLPGNLSMKRRMWIPKWNWTTK